MQIISAVCAHNAWCKRCVRFFYYSNLTMPLNEIVVNGDFLFINFPIETITICLIICEISFDWSGMYAYTWRQLRMRNRHPFICNSSLQISLCAFCLFYAIFFLFSSYFIHLKWNNFFFFCWWWKWKKKRNENVGG